MSTKRLLALASLSVGLLMAVAAAPSTAQAANPSSGAPPTLPQVASATDGAAWLAAQFNAAGFIPVTGAPNQADLSSTANAVLALASAGDRTVADHGLSYLAANVDAYVSTDGSDGPGQLALLILDAHALGANPESFGGSDLVARLLATEQPSGLFGVQDATYDGAYRQGLALSALAAVGVTGTPAVVTADRWLQGQQCPDGGWTSLITADNPCNGDPANYVGPDTNSTAQAIQGLSAQGALTPAATRLATKFIKAAQDPDGGWGYEPNAADAPGSTDPDSTALVIQAVLALGKSPSAVAFVRSGTNPVATLLSYQLTSGTGSGGFFYPGSSDADLLATYQALPAVAGVTDPFDLAVTTASLPGATVRGAYAVTLAASGATAPYRWKLVPGTGSLPAGLRLDATSGTISGRPRTPGTSSFAVEVFSTRSGTSPVTEAISWKAFSIVTSAAS